MNMIQIPIQLQLQLPLLIADKITNYLSFTTWRERMDKICQEYKEATNPLNLGRAHYTVIKDNVYNYRSSVYVNIIGLSMILWSNPKIHDKNGKIICGLSTNY